MAHDFISGGDHLGFMPWAKGQKVDRLTIVGLVAALEEWLEGDYEGRVIEYRRRASVIEQALDGIDGVQTELLEHGPTLRVAVGPAVGKSARQVADDLDAGEPRIKVGVEDEALNLAVLCSERR